MLLTGGVGFLGSHLCERLLNMKVMTFCVLTTSTRGVRPISPKNNGCVVSKEEY